MTLVRSLLAVPLGALLLLFMTFAVIDAAGLWLFPLPAGMEIGTTPMNEIIASRPFGAVLLGDVLRLPAVFASAWVAARIAPSYGIWHGTAVAVLFTAFVVAGALFAPFPLWATLLSIVFFPLVGFLGARRGAKELNA